MRKMKSSGIEWIGDIPADWGVTKVKNLYNTQLGKMLQPNPNGGNESLEKYLCSINVTWDGVNQSDIKEMWFNDWEKEIYRVLPRDLLISEGGDAGRACICNMDFPCYIQNAVHRVRTNGNALNKYLFYWMMTLKYIGYIDLLCNKATIMHFTQDKLRNIDMPCPPILIQQTLIGFLDREYQEINEVINVKQRQNTLLQEQRQTIIYEAVTQGLNKNVGLKTNGIDWISEVPENWQSIKIKYLCKIDPDRLPENTDNNYSFEYIDISSVNDLGKISGVTKTRFEDSPSRARMVVNKNDIIVSTVRTYLKAIAQIPEDNRYVCSTGFAVLRPNQGLNSRFFYYQIQSEYLVQLIVSYSTGVSYPAINASKLGDFYSLVPPLNEQKIIADYLDQRCADIDQVIDSNNRLIEKLKEYRLSLIYEVVTGKVAV